MWFFIFDWQVVLILPHTEDFSHRLTSFQPRDYRVVVVVQEIPDNFIKNRPGCKSIFEIMKKF